MPPRPHLSRLDMPKPGATAPLNKAVVTFELAAPVTRPKSVEMPVEVEAHRNEVERGETDRVRLEAQYTLREHLLQLANALPARPDGPDRPGLLRRTSAE